MRLEGADDVALLSSLKLLSTCGLCHRSVMLKKQRHKYLVKNGPHSSIAARGRYLTQGSRTFNTMFVCKISKIIA